MKTQLNNSNVNRAPNYGFSCESSDFAPKITRKRGGFGMVFAIIITVLVASLGILAIKLSNQTLNTTTNEYIAIQLDLYMNSTTELAILYVQRNGFVCNEGSDCDEGPLNTDNVKGGKRDDVEASIEKFITYEGGYQFKYKMTPLGDNDQYDCKKYVQSDAEFCQNSSNPATAEFKEETKNIFVLDIAGQVTSPITGQTLRVTKRQIIKP